MLHIALGEYRKKFQDHVRWSLFRFLGQHEQGLEGSFTYQLVLLAILFMLEQRLQPDVATLLKLVLPRKDITEDEVLRQLEVQTGRGRPQLMQPTENNKKTGRCLWRHARQRIILVGFVERCIVDNSQAVGQILFVIGMNNGGADHLEMIGDLGLHG